MCCVFRERDELLKINITLKLENGHRAAPLQTGKQSERVGQFCDDLTELQKTSLLGSIFVFSSLRRLFVIFISCFPCPFCFRFLFFSLVSSLPLLRSMTIHSYKFLPILCRSTQVLARQRILHVDFGTMYCPRNRAETAQHIHISLYP